jgi:hypothetical protein
MGEGGVPEGLARAVQARAIPAVEIGVAEPLDGPAAAIVEIVERVVTEGLAGPRKPIVTVIKRAATE